MGKAKSAGKEAAYIKNELLGAYLEHLLMIVGQREQRICYVDCSAGPRGRGGLDAGAASAALSLGILEKCHDELSQKFRRNVQFRALFIEKDKGAFNSLKDFIDSESWGAIDVRCINGDFCDLQPEILSWCGNGNFGFFVIDAGEPRHMAIPNLAPLLARPYSEFFISFALDSLLETSKHTDLEEHLETIFGNAPDLSKADGEDRDRFLFKLYRRELKTAAPISAEAVPRCGHMKIVNPAADKTVYDLVYLTWDPVGLVTFMDASEQLDAAQRKERALERQSKKVKRSGQLEMFSAEKFVVEEHAFDSGKVKEYWLSKLSHTPRQFGVSELADMLEETGWFMEHFQTAFSELEREGKVRNLASSGMRSGNPVRYWANGNRGEPCAKRED